MDAATTLTMSEDITSDQADEPKLKQRQRQHLGLRLTPKPIQQTDLQESEEELLLASQQHEQNLSLRLVCVDLLEEKSLVLKENVSSMLEEAIRPTLAEPLYRKIQ